MSEARRRSKVLVAAMSADEVYATFRTSAAGLDDAEVVRRRREVGKNLVPRGPRLKRFARIVRHFMRLFAILLWFVAALAWLSERLRPGQGMAGLGLAIVAVVIVNGAFSAWQDARAERALEALESLLPDRVLVRRGGIASVVRAEEVEPGDVLEVKAGVRVPADARLVAASDVRVDNATLTGESVPVWRDASPSHERTAVAATNLVLAGTTIRSGSASAVVIATGSHTEFAEIAELVQGQAEVESPLQREVRRVARVLGVLSVAMALVFAGLGVLRGMSPDAAFLFAIGVLVANVPEGLLPTTTLALAMASQRMARCQVVVRHLPAVEALGRASVICTDKTGTLTENRMCVQRLWFDGRTLERGDEAGLARAAREPTELFEALVLCEHVLDATQRPEEPMEAALYALGVEALGGPPNLLRTLEIPFDPERRRSTVACRDVEGARVFVKGALESVLPLATRVATARGEAVLDAAERERWLGAEAGLASEGLRVLAIAHRRTQEMPPRSELERDLVLVGLVGLHDPPRAGVASSLARCRRAGIRVLMLTGDHPRTALAVARVRADQKLRIVVALQAKGELVAVTGDGVNDAPALRAADVGVAMGSSGTEVARAAADVVLLDDDFSNIVKGVEEGRAVYSNSRKFLAYVLASNVPELVPYLAYTLFGVPLPLTVPQILAVDLGTDLVPALGLGAEQPEPQTMTEPPRPRRESLLAAGLLPRAYGVLGMSEAIAAMTAYAVALRTPDGYATAGSVGHRAAATACFVAIVVMQAANVFSCRSEVRSSFALATGPSRLVWTGIVLEVAAVALVVWSPLGHMLFDAVPFRLVVWPILVGFAALRLGLDAVTKSARRSFG